MAEIPSLIEPFRPLIDAQRSRHVAEVKAAARIEEAAERGARAAVAAAEDGLIDAAEVALILGISEDRVWALTRDGDLPVVKLGRRTYRYRRGAVREAIAELEE